MRRAERPGPGQNQEQSTKLIKQVSELKTFCEEGFEDIKLLLITDSDKFADRLLGDGPESLVPAGDEKKAERYVKAVQKATSQINLRKDKSHG